METKVIIIPDGKICDYIDGKFRNDTPEEYVRQTVEKRLVNEHKYSRDRICVEYTVQIGSGKKRADIVIFPDEETDKKQENIKIIIECKSEKIEANNAKDGVAQLKSYMSACPNAEWGMWTNSKEKFVFKKFTDDKGVIQFMDYNDIPSADGNIDDINRPKRASLKNASDDNLLFTFKTCHNHIYVNEGMQKQPAFFELLKVIFCKIEDERNLMLENVSNELEKLEKEISLNDVNKMNNNNIQNMNLYIFLDKGKNLETSLNNALKATSLVREIKELNILISDININNGKIKVSGLNGDISKINGEILLDGNTKALVNGQNNDYIITYNKDTLNTKTLFTTNKISSIIEYSKNDLLEGKVLKLSSELILENNNFKNLNRTVLTDEEKTLLTKKIENLRNNNYQQIMTKYEEDNKNIETLIDNVYTQKSKLDKLQRDLLSLGTIITVGQPIPATAINENDSQNNNSTINILNNPNSNSNNDTKNQNTSQNSNRINIGK